MFTDTQATQRTVQPSAPPPPPVGEAPPRSVPVARKRMSARGLVLSVLIVLLGGVAAYAGASMLIEQQEVLVVAREVPAGQVITAEDLGVAAVSKDPGIDVIPVSERASVVGLVAQTRLVAGSLLTPGMIGAGTGLEPGSALVALALKEGQLPSRGLTPGVKVRIVGTPGQQLQPTETTDSGSFQGTVANVGAMNPQTQLTVVDVQVANADAEAIAKLASTGNVAVIVVPE